MAGEFCSKMENKPSKKISHTESETNPGVMESVEQMVKS
jgi:hypothetical protein